MVKEDDERKSTLFATGEKPSSIPVVKKVSIADRIIERKQKYGQSSGDEGKFDSGEQGIIPSNPSVQQETGQRFYSEESDKYQIITELSDYTGETIGNNEGGGDVNEPRMERLNTEQINEGVTYSTGGIGIRLRGYHNYNSNRPRHPPPLQYALAPEPRLSGATSYRSRKSVVKDLQALQKEILDRKLRMKYEVAHEENLGSILEPGDEPYHIEDQFGDDSYPAPVAETVSRNFYTHRGTLRGEVGASAGKFVKSRNFEIGRYQTERQYVRGRRGVELEQATYNNNGIGHSDNIIDTDKSVVLTQEDGPNLKRMDKISLERAVAYQNVCRRHFFCFGDAKEEKTKISHHKIK